MVLTIAAVAASKGITLDEAAVDIHRQTSEGTVWQTSFRIEIHLAEGLTKREKAILYNSARKCEVHKMLNGQFRFDYELSGTAG
jgi:uncharacterized OsmC-like protein